MSHVARYAFAAAFCTGKRMIDFGCGSGYGSWSLTPFAKAVLGLDLSPEAIEYATVNFGPHSGGAELRYELHDLALDFPQRADIGLSFEVIEHLRPAAWEAFVCRVSKAVPELLISTPAGYGDGRKVWAPHEWELTPPEFERILKMFYGSVLFYSQIAVMPEPDDLEVTRFILEGSTTEGWPQDDDLRCVLAHCREPI